MLYYILRSDSEEVGFFETVLCVNPEPVCETLDLLTFQLLFFQSQMAEIKTRT